jgi:hypothetical protein
MFYAAIMGSVTAFLIQAQFNPNVILLWVLFWMAITVGSVAWELSGVGSTSVSGF